MADIIELLPPYNVNMDNTLESTVGVLIDADDVKELRFMAKQYPSLDLSRYPGQWDTIAVRWTPIGQSIVSKSREVFTFLIGIVDLEVPILCSGISRHEQYMLTIFEACVRHGANLSYACRLCENCNIFIPGKEIHDQPFASLIRQLMEYAGKLTDVLQAESPEYTTAHHHYRNLGGLLRKMIKVELKGKNQANINMMMRIFTDETIFPRTIRKENVVGSTILQMLISDIDFNIELLDLSHLFFNDSTSQIYDILVSKRSERNLAVASVLYKNNQSPMSVLPKHIVMNIAWRNISPHLHDIQVDQCCVCLESKHVHVVCRNTTNIAHKLCTACHFHMVRLERYDCPLCRQKMLGT
jgi:hypothetical protein